MKTMRGTVVSVHAGSRDDLSKPHHSAVEVDLEGFVGDAHRGYTRQTWAGDKQAEGTTRRNERQWSAVSVEELEEISKLMDLTKFLSAESLGANLCFRGVPNLSRLPKGTVIRFPSGAELQVEEYNPPCHDMGKNIAAAYMTNSGKEIASTAFPKAAMHTRGIVGVVEVGGVIRAGDDVTIVFYEPPPWLR